MVWPTLESKTAKEQNRTDVSVVVTEFLNFFNEKAAYGVVLIQTDFTKYRQNAVAISKRRSDASSRSERSSVWHQCCAKPVPTR